MTLELSDDKNCTTSAAGILSSTSSNGSGSVLPEGMVNVGEPNMASSPSPTMLSPASTISNDTADMASLSLESSINYNSSDISSCESPPAEIMELGSSSGDDNSTLIMPPTSSSSSSSLSTRLLGDDKAIGSNDDNNNNRDAGDNDNNVSGCDQGAEDKRNGGKNGNESNNNPVTGSHHQRVVVGRVRRSDDKLSHCDIDDLTPQNGKIAIDKSSPCDGLSSPPCHSDIINGNTEDGVSGNDGHYFHDHRDVSPVCDGSVKSFGSSVDGPIIRKSIGADDGQKLSKKLVNKVGFSSYESVSFNGGSDNVSGTTALQDSVEQGRNNESQSNMNETDTIKDCRSSSSGVNFGETPEGGQVVKKIPCYSDSSDIKPLSVLVNDSPHYRDDQMCSGNKTVVPSKDTSTGVDSKSNEGGVHVTSQDDTMTQRIRNTTFSHMGERIGDCHEEQRQRSLGPESCGESDTSSTSADGQKLQRSSSYPQVCPKLLFTPIRPCLEDSGLFMGDVESGQLAENTTPPTIMENCKGEEESSNANVSLDNSVSGRSLTEKNTTGNKRDNSKLHGHHHHQSNLPVARVNPQTNPTISAVQQQLQHQQLQHQQLQQQQQQQQHQQLQQQPQDASRKMDANVIPMDNNILPKHNSFQPQLHHQWQQQDSSYPVMHSAGMQQSSYPGTYQIPYPQHMYPSQNNNGGCIMAGPDGPVIYQPHQPAYYPVMFMQQSQQSAENFYREYTASGPNPFYPPQYQPSLNPGSKVMETPGYSTALDSEGNPCPSTNLVTAQNLNENGVGRISGGSNNVSSATTPQYSSAQTSFSPSSSSTSSSSSSADALKSPKPFNGPSGNGGVTRGNSNNNSNSNNISNNNNNNMFPRPRHPSHLTIPVSKKRRHKQPLLPTPPPQHFSERSNLPSFIPPPPPPPPPLPPINNTTNNNNSNNNNTSSGGIPNNPTNREFMHNPVKFYSHQHPHQYPPPPPPPIPPALHHPHHIPQHQQQMYSSPPSSVFHHPNSQPVFLQPVPSASSFGPQQQSLSQPPPVLLPPQLTSEPAANAQSSTDSSVLEVISTSALSSSLSSSPAVSSAQIETFTKSSSSADLRTDTALTTCASTTQKDTTAATNTPASTQSQQTTASTICENGEEESDTTATFTTSIITTAMATTTTTTTTTPGTISSASVFPQPQSYETASSSTRSLVDCIACPSGLVIYGPQTPFHERLSSQNTGQQYQQTHGPVSIGLTNPVENFDDLSPNSETIQPHPVPSIPPHAFNNGLVYVQDPTGAIVVMDASVVFQNPPMEMTSPTTMHPNMYAPPLDGNSASINSVNPVVPSMYSITDSGNISVNTVAPTVFQPPMDNPNPGSTNTATTTGQGDQAVMTSPPPQQLPVAPGSTPESSGPVDSTGVNSPGSSPATVRMRSYDGPPAPLPMQVPPGHMVQQLVDENGVLTHVLVFPQHPAPSISPMSSMGHYGGGPANGSQYYSYGGGYPPNPNQYPHPHHPVPPHVHGGIPSHIQASNNQNCSNHTSPTGPSPPLNSTDGNLRTRNRVRKKLQQRRVNGNENYYPNPPRFQGGGGRRPRNMNGDVNSMHGNEMPMYPGGQGGMPQENGPMESEEESNLIIQCLSALPEPKVTDVDARSAKVKLSPPECGESMEIYPSDLKYELFLSDSGRDKKYDSVFCGVATDINLKVLTPATEYFLKVCAILQEELKGNLTEPVSFRTSACEPDTPPHPELFSKARTSLSLKWNGTVENGSKITAYCLESDQGAGEENFIEVYSGVQRRCKVSGLNSSTRYVFRVAAVNAFGKSQYSQSMAFYTSGLVPSQPDPPMLSEKSVLSLTISWIKRPNDEEFLLQMEDDTTGHGFLPVYNGPNLCYKVCNLRRNEEYKFRMCAKNEEGYSKWSETVTFRTRPNRPQCPGKPQIKGKIHSHSFKITWDPPTDTGGMDINKYIVELDDGQGYEVVYEGSAREHQFDTLLPGHSYRVRVMCFSAGGRSEYSDYCVATTLPVTPGQCLAPKLQGKPKATSLHLRWSYPDYDGGSQVTAFAVEMISPDNTTREVYKGHDLDCIVAGLLPGRPYLFQIRAFNRAGAGLWSELLEVVSGAGVPDTPKPPKVTSRSSHNAVVNWEEPFNNGATVTDYRLEWQQKSDSAEFTQLHVGSSMNYECRGMSPATFYAFRVQAINSAGPSPFSPATHYSTPASSPAAIVSVKAQMTASTAQLSWREPHNNGSDIVSYNIVINDKPAIFVDPVTEYLLEDLKPETNYRVRIQALNSIGAGPYSSPIKVTTKALPPSPPRLECVLLLSNSIKLKWGEGRPTDLLTYTLEMERDDGSFQPVYYGPAHTHKVNRLSELKTFEFRIFASNDAGKGPYSDTYSFTTTKAPPPALKAPKVQSKNLTSVTLEWQGVKPMGSDSIAYILQLMTCGGRNSEYKQIYKGPNTSFQYDFQSNHTEYQARVAAIRISSDCSSSSSGSTATNATTSAATSTSAANPGSSHSSSSNKNNNSGDIIGAFSPGTGFSRKVADSNKSSSDSSAGHSRDRHVVEKKPWTDQQRALAFVLVFSLLAILFAFICQQVVSSYFSGSTSDPGNPSPPHPPQSSSIP